MNFSQRRSHLFTWICISILLGIGFLFSAYYALQNPIGEPIHDELIFNDITLDSIYVEKIDTEFVLKDSGQEKYLEAKVLSPQAITSLKVYQDKKFLGSIGTTGTHILSTSGDKIGNLIFIDLITGEEI